MLLSGGFVSYMSFYYKSLKKYRRKKDHIAQKVRETLLQIDNLNETVFRDSITVENNPSMSGGKTVLFLGTGASEMIPNPMCGCDLCRRWRLPGKL
jgi:hypothetical protein